MSTPASDTSTPACSKVVFIKLSLTTDRLFSRTVLGDSFQELSEMPINSITVEARDLGNLRGVQINGKQPYDLADFVL